MKEYYVLSLKKSHLKENYSWFKSNNSGYTEDLNYAGVYTEEEISKNKNYYFNSNSQVAIPKEVVDNLLIARVVPTFSSNYYKMNLGDVFKNLPVF